MNEKELQNSAEFAWLNKKVSKKICVYKPDNNFISNLNTKVILDNKFLYHDLPTITLSLNTRINDLSERVFSSFSVIPSISDWSDYQRYSSWIYIEAEGHYNFYLHYCINQVDKPFTHAVSIEPNKWVRVLFEFDHNQRDNIDKINIGILNLGCPPEGVKDILCHFSFIDIEQVKADYTLGWDIEDRLAYSHYGYLPNSKKGIYTTYINKEDDFYLFNEQNEKVYQNKIKHIKDNNNKPFIECDFTDFNKEGSYYLIYGNRNTHVFPINNNVINPLIDKSLIFLKLLHCGDDVKGVHTPCHLTSYTLHPITNERVPNFGGWHDAGDVSQFAICTAEMAHALLDLSEVYLVKDHNRYQALIDEARVGLNWLMRTRFGDGYRAMGVTYSIWRDNVFNSNPNNMKPSLAEAGAFENLLASSAEAQGYLSTINDDLIFANWCKRCAIADYDFAMEEIKNKVFTKRWGEIPTSELYGEVILASVLLYQITKDDKYLQEAIIASDKVMKCQQTDDVIKDFNLKGYFYEDELHTKNLVFEHRGHFDAVIYGLTKLYKLLPNHPKREEWRNCLELFSNFIKASVKYTYPYEVLPAGIYELDKINLNSYTIPATITKMEAENIIKKQIINGEKITDNMYLRKMGVAVSRRGFHATMLSLAKAASSVATVLNDNELKTICQKQIEWIIGTNPFASSSMYMEGNHYHPLYVAFSNQLEGALPVGFKTFMDEDKPYWPTIDNAVFKEIWGHTTGKFLWVLADIIKHNN